MQHFPNMNVSSAVFSGVASRKWKHFLVIKAQEWESGFLALLQTCWVALDKSLNAAVPQFLHL